MTKDQAIKKFADNFNIEEEDAKMFIDFVEEELKMVPAAKHTEPEYTDNGKQLQTRIVNEWDK